PSSKACQKSGPFPPPALPGFDSTMTPSDSRLDRRPERRRRGCWPRPQRGSPGARITFPACHAHYPGESVGGARRLLAHPCCLPRQSAGSASAISLSRPTQASLALWPAGLLDRPRRPLSRGFGPVSYPTQPLVSYQTYRQLSGWNLPPLVIRAIGAHCHEGTSQVLDAVAGNRCCLEASPPSYFVIGVSGLLVQF